MNDDIDVKRIFTSLIAFLLRNKNALLAFVIIGVMIVISFQKFKQPYYITKAICTSGIVEYEQLEQADEISQRTAIDLINTLDLLVKDKSYEILANILQVRLSVSESIKSIKAEQLYQQNKDEKFFALNKFELYLETYNPQLIDSVQQGLINYFYKNKYISNYQSTFIDSRDKIIESINKEISDLNQIRSEGNCNNLALQSTSILSGENQSLNNEIVALSHFKELLKSEKEHLEPLSFVQPFYQVDQPEDDILIGSTLSAIISLLFGALILYARETQIKL